MRIVLTGASGLMGRRLIERLVPDHEVWALSRRLVSPAPNLRWVACDLSEPSLPGGLPDGADAVVHLAQSSRFREFPDGALDVFAVNVASTARLLDWAQRAGVAHFVLASSGGLAAPAAGQPYYLSSKHAAELLATSYRQLFQVLVLRFFFVYGPHQEASMLVPRLIAAVESGRPVRLPGASGPRLNPIHVAEAVEAIAAALAARAVGTLDIAGPEILTLRNMCEQIGAAVGKAPVFDRRPETAEAHLVGDIGEMSARLVRPRVTFAEGLADLLRSGGGGVDKSRAD